MAQTEIAGKSLVNDIPPGVMDGFLEESDSDFITNGYTLTISGWVVGFVSPAVSIELIHAFTTLRSIPINLPRPDVMAVIAPGAEASPCGFAAAIGALGLAPEFAIDLIVTFADGLRGHWQTIRGRRASLPISFQQTMHPHVLPIHDRGILQTGRS